VKRHTFVVQVHSHGPSILENLSTRERVPVSDLAVVGPQIERWLAALAAGEPDPRASARPARAGPGTTRDERRAGD
jgi:hypothetical protein